MPSPEGWQGTGVMISPTLQEQQDTEMALRMLSYMRRPSSTAETTVAKLSSVRMMSAASLCHVGAHNAHSSSRCRPFLRAGASLTPSPVIATTLPLLLPGVHNAHLVLGRRHGHRPRSARPSAQSSSSLICSSSAPGDRPDPPSCRISKSLAMAMAVRSVVAR